MALGEIMLIVYFLVMNTVGLENGNASIKHALDVMSTHVDPPSVARLSADRALARLRAMGRHRKAPPGSKPKPKPRVTRKMKQCNAKRKAEGKPPIDKRKRRGGGGAWRTFVSRARRGTLAPSRGPGSRAVVVCRFANGEPASRAPLPDRNSLNPRRKVAWPLSRPPTG